MNGPAGVLWDMDGLLVDTEPLWTVAERELCQRWGIPFDAAVKQAMMGRRLDASVPILLAAAGVDEDPAEVARFLLTRTAQLFAGGVTARPGAVALLERLRDAGVAQALVSSSYRLLVDALPVALSGFFGTTVAGDEVAAGKPDPEGYLRAAAALGVDPRECVVLEDSLAGARAGQAAGARVVLVPSVPGLAAEPGWRVVDSLADICLADLAD